MRLLVAGLIIANTILAVAIFNSSQPAPLSLGCMRAPHPKGKYWVSATVSDWRGIWRVS
jgi:hypothetical protein